MRLLLLFILLSCWFAPVYGTTDTSAYYHFTTENGLPSDNVYSVIQDRNGFIWLATDNGIAKYDGYGFKVFTTEDGLPSNDIWQMIEDPDGKIWLFSNSFEIGYMKNDRYYAAYSDLKGEKVFPTGFVSLGPITAVFYLMKGCFYALVTINNNFVVIPLFLQSFGVPYASIYQKQIWVFYPNNIISKYDLIHFEKSKIVKANLNLLNLLHTANGGHVDDQYFYSFAHRMKYIRIYNINNQRLNTVDMDKLGSGNIITCYMSSDGLFVIPQKGIYKITNATISRIADNPPTTSQTTYFADFGDKWICTNGDGIWIKPLFTFLKNTVLDKEQLFDFNLIGSGRDTAYWWNPRSGAFIGTKANYVVTKQKFTGYGTLKRLSLGIGKLAILSTTGPYAYSPHSNTLVNLFKDHSLVAGASAIPQQLMVADTLRSDSLKTAYYFNVQALFNISDSSLVISGNSWTDYVVRTNNMYITSHLIVDQATGHTVLNDEWHCLYNPRNVYLFSKDFKRMRYVTYQQLKQLGIDNIQKITVYNNDIYVLTQSSLFRFRYPSVERLETGLNVSSASMSIVNKHLVFLGNFGIAYRHINASSGTPFKIMLNYKHLDFGKIESRWIDTSGNILFTTHNHSYYVHFDSLIRNNTSMTNSSSLIRFVANQRQIPLSKTDTLHLTDEQFIQIKPISQCGSGHFQIYYTFDTKPLQKTLSGEIPTGDITPGKYYTIKYYLQDDFWRTPLHTLHIIRTPLWYQRTEWKVVFAMAILSVFGGAMLIAFSVAKRMTTKANEKRRLQTELELRAIHAQINPHFIYNTLSTALFFISKQQTKNAYEHVAKFSKLLRNYLTSSRERFITLAEEIEMLTQYIELQRARFSKSFQYELNIAPEIRPKHILLPSLLLQPLVENAINHGLFNKSEGGFLKINFLQGQADDTLICIIEDNGIGRRRSMQRNAVKTEKKSYGTALTQDLINILERYERMDIKVEYQDKTEPETGTIVKLTIHNVKTISSSFKPLDETYR